MVCGRRCGLHARLRTSRPLVNGCRQLAQPFDAAGADAHGDVLSVENVLLLAARQAGRCEGAEAPLGLLAAGVLPAARWPGPPPLLACSTPRERIRVDGARSIGRVGARVKLRLQQQEEEEEEALLRHRGGRSATWRKKCHVFKCNARLTQHA
eukprot:6957566-Prymnesium_polylepis.3